MRWLLLTLLVLTSTLGDILQSYEMKRAGRQSADARGLLRLIGIIAGRRYLILAIASMAVSFFVFLALIQTEPLSFVVPASAASFILETFLARFVLKERVGSLRVAGVILIFTGILLVAK